MLLGKVDYPCIRREAPDTFLTVCDGTPRVLVTPGGTFVSVAFITQVPALARVQVFDSPPQLDALKHPFFPTPSVIAGAVTTLPTIVHRLSMVDELLAPETDGHIALRTNQEFWFSLLVWNEQGRYDIAWNTTGLVGATPPEPFTTKNRAVRARLAKLHCHDTSDDWGSGTGTLHLRPLRRGHEGDGSRHHMGSDDADRAA
ncbi:hypothetical protein ACIBG6_38440 [Streptomyces sp. NPDC050842]|uniref:hypothetical protein n=1 Tax=Streptomyces sp. NPDC050842 TaxID=3365636 RepID=UPI0037A4DAD3